MRIRTEICDEGCDEIIIRCSSQTNRIKNIETVLESLLMSEREMTLQLSGTEYYVPIKEILFFEAFDGKVYSHTAERMYMTPYKLFELENIMPSSFVRISKSTIANIMLITSLHREIVGNGEISFRGCEKKAYFSRGYYKVLRDKIDEMRLGK